MSSRKFRDGERKSIFRGELAIFPTCRTTATAATFDFDFESQHRLSRLSVQSGPDLNSPAAPRRMDDGSCAIWHRPKQDHCQKISCRNTEQILQSIAGAGFSTARMLKASKPQVERLRPTRYPPEVIESLREPTRLVSLLSSVRRKTPLSGAEGSWLLRAAR